MIAKIYTQKSIIKLTALLTSIICGIILSLTSSIVLVNAQPSSGDTPYTCYNNSGAQVSCPSGTTFPFAVGKCYRIIPENQGQTAIIEFTCPNSPSGANGSGGTNNSSFQDPPITTDCEPEEGQALDSSNCGIIRILVAAINVLSGLAGIAIIGSIVFAGYQYMTAQDNSGRIQQARQRIIWAITALFLLIFMYAFLNWLVPGGVL